MKKALFAMVLAMVVAASAQALTIGLVPSALTVTPSTIFVIDVVVTGAAAPGVEVIDVVVTYNPALVTGVDAAEGAWMRTGGPLLEFEEVNNVAGYVSYTAARLGPNGSTGSGTAVTLTFHCEGPGLTALAYYVNVSDTNGDIIADGTGVIEIQQGGGQVIPEPMTLALVGVALTALGVVARKRS